MNTQLDWFKILTDCKNNVEDTIKPHLKTLNEPQPDLGEGAGGDAMKPIDLAAEKAIVNTLQDHGISFSLISEESGFEKYGNTPEECYVTIDPIDGTTNLLRGLPFYASSIAISRKPFIAEVYAALVTDLYHDITYMAQKNKGAYRDGERIKPSQISNLQEAVIGMDLNSYKVAEIAPKLTDLIQQTRHIRHYGANALELCYVANGLTDAFVDIRGKLRTTDAAAGFLIVKEAGGLITDINNQSVNVKLDPRQSLNFVASGNAKIHNTILGLVKS
ncbi:MAG: D-fructose 1,6-bisphosphatase [Candidatus Bathyarchaeota archaeon]|nr:D-fructose 1,6-bisphosphatase [Candidatus Termiticorpusculum sp.]MCL1970915.1 D-fructose 1,6-bisphosphatase [Candidatus Termiticorpusculum sp.]